MKYYFLLILFMPTTLSGQSIDSLIEMAIQNNHGLKSLSLEYEAAQQKAGQVGGLPDPRVSLGLGVSPIQTRLGPQVARVGVQQAIPQKGLLIKKRSIAQSRAEIKASLESMQLLDIEYAIRTAYAQLIQIKEEQSIINKKLVVFEGLEELAKSKLRSGKGSLSDNLLIERSRIDILNQKDLLEKEKESYLIKINRWTGRPLLTEVNLVDTTIRSNTSSVSIDLHPKLQWLDQQIQVSEEEAELTNIEQKPSIMVGLDYALVTSRKDVEISGNGRDVLMPMGSINIPLNRSVYQSRRQEERLNQASILERIQDTKSSFEAAISSAISDIEYVEIGIEKIKDLQEITMETIKLMKTEYASEGTGLEEILRLEMDLLEYEIQLSMMNLRKSIGYATLQIFN